MGNSLIVGGGLRHNNGAQAMTYITVSELKKRFPNSPVYQMHRGDFRMPRAEKAKYNFSILNELPLGVLLRLAGFPMQLLSLRVRVDKKQLAETIALLQNSDRMLDVSGYNFGTQWGFRKSLIMLLRIQVCKKYGLKVYLMPQSFGPTNFRGIKGMFLNWYAKRSFPKADLIFVRERAGYDALTETYGLNNVRQTGDLVLLNKQWDPHDVFTHPTPPKHLSNLQAKPVAILPNKKTFEHGDEITLLDMYDALISHLLDQGRSIYLLHHAPADALYCEKIKARFSQEPRVLIISDDFTSIDFESILPQFDFLIASRYHAIVHAYKHGVPCLVPGWAVKYSELTQLFGQFEYMFSVLKKPDLPGMLAALDTLDQNHIAISKHILGVISDLEKYNVYDSLQ